MQNLWSPVKGREAVFPLQYYKRKYLFDQSFLYQKLWGVNRETMAIMGSSKLLIIFSGSLLLSLATLALSADDPFFECRYAKDKGNFTANSPYQTNLNLVLSNLSSIKDFNYGFHNLSAGKGSDKVFAIALCAGDRTPDQCSSCLKDTVTKLTERCPRGKEVVAWSQFCMVRYANRDIFGQLDRDPRTCAYNPRNASNPNDFNQTLTNLLNSLSKEAAAGGPLRKYAAGNATDAASQTVYASVQCTPDLNEQNCSTCLSFAMSELQMCCVGKMGCRVLRPSCILRFDSSQFYNLTTIVPLPSAAPSPSPIPSSPPPPTSSSPIPSRPPPTSSSPISAPPPRSSAFMSPIVNFPIILQLCFVGLITIKHFV